MSTYIHPILEAPKYVKQAVAEGMMLKLKLQYFGHLIRRTDSLEKTLILGREWGQKGTTEDEMVGWHLQLDGHEFG